MQIVILCVLVAAVFAFFSTALQDALRRRFERHPALIWLTPVVLTGVFIRAEVVADALSLPLTLAVLAYTAAPVLCAFLAGPGGAKQPSALDFGAILLLWLPLEFGAGARLVPLRAQGFLHSVAYAAAILLGLTIFLCFRNCRGMKYNLPRRLSDLGLPLVAFAITAPVLIAVGIPIGFIPLPHLPATAGSRMATAAGLIFAGTALPEEILFRSLIQNLIMQRWGSNTRTLFLAAFIFGCAHLDNGPQPLPNWRYMILATIAGVAYGEVFRRSTTVTSSALLHTMVDWTKHFVF